MKEQAIQMAKSALENSNRIMLAVANAHPGLDGRFREALRDRASLNEMRLNELKEAGL